MYRNDRRMFDRFEVNFSTELKEPGTQEGSSAQCHDISASGVGLLAEAELIPRTNLEIGLGIPNGHLPFRGVARVIWSKQVQENKWRSGLEFETVDFMGIRRIFETMAKKA